jgi:hypothetical protein
MMKIFSSALILLATINISANASDISEMYNELRKYINHEGTIILLAQARYESSCGKKGVARKNGYNWWNVTCGKGGESGFERENGQLVRKRWYLWRTPEQGAKEFVAYLERKHPGALKRASEGNIEGYVRILRRNGYFSENETNYRLGIKRSFESGL